MLCKPTGLFRSAKVWIENRNLSAVELGNIAIELDQLLTAFNAAEGEEKKALADQYNALTTKIGFN